MRLVKTHGSLNEIFALDAAPDAWESDAALREFVRRVCDRSAWTGGSDGIYLYDASGPDAQAWFFNPDGSSAEFCGNGMRGLGRLILDLRGTDTEVIGSGGRDYTVHRAASTAEGVRQVLLELPPLRFDEAALPEPFQDFTAVAVPNPHVIAVVAEYSEPDLIDLGKRAGEVFTAGANVSFLQPLGGRRRARGLRPHLRARRGPDPVLRLRGGGVPRRLLPRVRPRPRGARRGPQRRGSGRRDDPASATARGTRYSKGTRRSPTGRRPARPAIRRARWTSRPTKIALTRCWTSETPPGSKSMEFKPPTPNGVSGASAGNGR